MPRVRISIVTGAIFSFAIFALAAQFSKGNNMSLSPVQMAATQPYVLWQAMLGCVAGIVLGFRGGQCIARVRHRPLSRPETSAADWVVALLRLIPWVVASFLSREGYQSLMITSPWAALWMTRLLPLTGAFDHSFLLGFAMGYFRADNPHLGKRAQARSAE